jgi:predicted unusual protein kinase regulating ubiquinone biosynthesis (AarF/ABC1/UbiB family)
MLDYLKRLLIDQLPSFVNYMVVKNVMFTKLLQSMAGIDNMPHEIDEIIKKNTDHVNYTDDEIDFKLLVRVISDYKITLDSLTPINSGMVAIVFSGVNADKKRVVLKIRRKNIMTRIKNGYIQFSRLYNLVSFITYPFGYLDEILANVKSFIESRDYILTQCEFDKEIEAIVKTKIPVEEYADDIIIPTIYNSEQDRVNTEFILMERIEGTTCYDIEDRYREHACELICKYSFITSYFTDIMHTDLHPGNIFCIPDGDKCKIGVIDFGMHIYNTDEIREFSHGILNGYIEVDNGNTANLDILKHCANTTVPPIDLTNISPDQYKHLNKLFITFVVTIGTGKLDEIALHALLDGCRKVLKTNHILLSDTSMKYAMGLSMLQSSLRLLVSDNKKLSNIMKKALREVMSY